MSGASQDNIEQFTIFTASDPYTAKQWLERYDNVETAISEYFDKGGNLPPESQQQVVVWDESHFSTARDTATFGPLNRDQAEGHQVIGEDVFSQQHRNSPAIEDWMQNVPDTSEDQEETAMKAFPYKQANVRDLKPTGWSAKPIVNPPSASYRRREANGAPAVLRPASDSLLAPLVTILHQIPLAREALIGAQQVKSDYHCGSQWWNGKAVWADDEVSDPDSKIWAELQRLMAFHDATKRAYGPVSPLESALQETNKDLRSDQALLVQRSEFAMAKLPEDRLSTLFVTSIAKRPADRDNVLQSIYDLDLKIDPIVSETGGSLLDVVENALVSSAQDDDNEDSEDRAYMVRGADVLVVFLDPPSSTQPIGIRIPEEFHSARWFDDSTTSSEVHAARQEKHFVQNLLRKIDSDHKKLTTVKHPKGADDVSITKLFEDSIAHFKATETAKENTMEDKETNEALLARLQAAKRRVDEKIAVLEKSKTEALEAMRQASKRLNDLRMVQEEQGQASTDKGAAYSLRGVAVSPNDFFVIAGTRDPDDLISNTQWQWWSMDGKWHKPAEWTSTESFELKAVQSSAAAATTAAKDATSRIMLVYATEEAVKDMSSPLPAVLHRFIDHDNEAFEKEMSPWRAGSPSSTIAQKSDAGRRNSMDAQVTEVGSTQEGAIRLESNDPNDYAAPWSSFDLSSGNKENVPAQHRPAHPPQLPPRYAQAQAQAQAYTPQTPAVTTPATPSTLLQAPQPVAPMAASKRNKVLSGFKKALSRSKSRERSRERGAEQEDLLVDNDEQSMGIQAMNADVPSKARR